MGTSSFSARTLSAQLFNVLRKCFRNGLISSVVLDAIVLLFDFHKHARTIVVQRNRLCLTKLSVFRTMYPFTIGRLLQPLSQEIPSSPEISQCDLFCCPSSHKKNERARVMQSSIVQKNRRLISSKKFKKTLRILFYKPFKGHLERFWVVRIHNEKIMILYASVLQV